MCLSGASRRSPSPLKLPTKPLAATITTFEASSDKYRETIAASTNKARNDLVTHVHSETAKAIALGSAEERLAISEAAKYALRTETTAAVTKALQSSLTTSLDSAVAKLALQLRQPWSQRLLEYGLVALVASVFTVALLHPLAYVPRLTSRRRPSWTK